MHNFATNFIAMSRRTVAWTVLTAASVLLVLLCLFTGSVDIPYGETFNILTGGTSSNAAWNHILIELRVPATVTAALTGAALGVAGLLLQTTFNNPLAGPSILGVSTGASLGVAVIMLALPRFTGSPVVAIAGAAAGAMAVMALLLGFSSLVRSAMMLLIVGIMISYLTSSIIALLNFYATQEGVHSFVIWGLGDFNGVGLRWLGLYSGLCLLLIAASFFLVKPLNALLLGERYAADVGTDVVRTRNFIFLISGLLIALTTAFCGPIGFIGLAIPHIARIIFRTSNHRTLLPAIIVTGAATGLLTLYLSTVGGTRGTIPINALTPVIGVPVVIYIILNRRKLSYFN